MNEIEKVRETLAYYTSLEGGKRFFATLGYSLMEPLPLDLSYMPKGAQEAVASIHQLVHIDGHSPFRVFHVELTKNTIRRTDVRRFLEAFYRNYPQGENLFVFSPKGRFDELAFVSPRRLNVPSDKERGKVKTRLWLRFLQVFRDQPYRTDLEVLSHIQAHGINDPQEIWKLHDEAFRVQRVTDKFYEDYQIIFHRIRYKLQQTHPNNSPIWARDYTHLLLNRIMFLYFIARKCWLLGPIGEPDRNFMHHFWEAYKEACNAGRAKPDTFHSRWLRVLFFATFNKPPYERQVMEISRSSVDETALIYKLEVQSGKDSVVDFPDWLVNSLQKAPFLNGGLYTKRKDIDDLLQIPLPDEIFELLFEKWLDNTTPGFFERYNFTIVESDRFDEEVAVDPELLGIVYERLVNVTFESGGEDDLRGQAGVFYTPRIEIDLMSRLSLVDWLSGQLGDEYKELLYSWIFAFNEEEKIEADRNISKVRLWEKLDNLIRKVRVLDPACGSGSFLVGMMLILDDLQSRCDDALGRKETPYKRRKRILQEQLYGVDVMEWAVRVAELRLWLQLVVETDIPLEERYSEPLLPNLDFKLRPGDSLLQTVGDVDLSLFRQGQLQLPDYLKTRLEELRAKKHKYFEGGVELEGAVSRESLRQEERKVFSEILLYRMQRIKKTIKEKEAKLERLLSQTQMFKGALPTWTKQEKEQIESEIEKLKLKLRNFEKAYKAIQSVGIGSEHYIPFVWDIAFIEIFENENPGFDIVIGNPPYVRQEKIRDPLRSRGLSRKEYLQKLNESLRSIYPAFMGAKRRLSGRADYYIYFYLHGLSLLADKGTFCFITSNSWLDVDFGKDLQEFLLCYGHIKMIIDNHAKRSFSQADVNTVIVLLGPPERKRKLTPEEMETRLVHFVAFKKPFEEVLSPVVFLEIEDNDRYKAMAGFQILTMPEYRSVLWDQWSLYLDGLALPEERKQKEWLREKYYTYEGNKWGGKYLRAPDIFFTILEKGRRYKAFEYNGEVIIVEDITDQLEE